MDKELKDLVINFAYRFAEKLNIPGYAAYDYARRGELLELIRERDEKALQVLNQFSNAQEKVEIIRNESDLKNRDIFTWYDGLEKAKVDRAAAGRNVLECASKDGVNLEGLFNNW